MTGKHVVAECVELRDLRPGEVEEWREAHRDGGEQDNDEATGGRGEETEDELETFLCHIYEFLTSSPATSYNYFHTRALPYLSTNK